MVSVRLGERASIDIDTIRSLRGSFASVLPEVRRVLGDELTSAGLGMRSSREPFNRKSEAILKTFRSWESGLGYVAHPLQREKLALLHHVSGSLSPHGGVVLARSFMGRESDGKPLVDFIGEAKTTEQVGSAVARITAALLSVLE